MHCDERVSVGTEVYGDGRTGVSMPGNVCHFGSSRPTRPWYSALTHTHQPRLRLPPAAAPACVAQGLISKVRGVFPSLPYLLLTTTTTTTMSPAQTKKKKESQSVPVTATAGLHCIASARLRVIHLPGTEFCPAQCNARNFLSTTSTIMPTLTFTRAWGDKQEQQTMVNTHTR